MKTKQLAIAAAVGLAAVFIALLALGAFKQPEAPRTETLPQPPQTPVVLLGSGATFPMEQILAWASQVKKLYPWLSVEYGGGGTGKGQSDFLQGVVDFAGSDVPLKTSDWERARSLYGGVLQIPMILGGVAVVYNIPELPPGYNLRLTGEVLAEILLGKIEYWDDPRIAELNPGVGLPHQRIVFVHRSDSSGTTEVFTTYLSKVSSEWKSKVGAGKAVSWPLDALGRGVGAQGNPGVAQAVKSTPYSLGYVELAYTKGLGVVALRNRAGEFVVPSRESVMKAAEALPSVDPADDLSKLNILITLLDSEKPGAYPITSPSYLLVKAPSAYTPEKARAMCTFLRYVLTEGQEERNLAEGYAPLPKPLREALRSALERAGLCPPP
ncbi:MAG: phosphate ABC transporter substrate-binding protein PstS [Thermofilum sp.]|jgi:phosphate transport system substrate-binding protein|nr:phosphate ABC transporter substrate-binding protein PstS [Thermofilum sp.]